MYTNLATKDDRRLREREVQQGIVANSPADTTEDLYAIFPDFEDRGAPPHRHGPLYGWDAHSTGSLPTEGDLVLVTVSDQGDYWCLGWAANV